MKQWLNSNCMWNIRHGITENLQCHPNEGRKIAQEISLSTKEAMVNLVLAGATTQAVALHFKVSRKSVANWIRR